MPVNVGDALNTVLPVPVDVVTPVPPFPTATTPVTLDAVPVVFWFKVGKLQLAKLPVDGVPRAGVTNVGEFANTLAPLPVLSVRAVARLAEVKDPKEVTLLPLELTAPERLGIVLTVVAVKLVAVPVILVPTRVEGVPRFGVIKVGEVLSTLLPLPVLVVTPVPPFPTRTKPVTLDAVPVVFWFKVGKVQLTKLPVGEPKSASANVNPVIVVAISPNIIGVVPIVIGVAKLLSNWDKGIRPD